MPKTPGPRRRSPLGGHSKVWARNAYRCAARARLVAQWLESIKYSPGGCEDLCSDGRTSGIDQERFERGYGRRKDARGKELADKTCGENEQCERDYVFEIFWKLAELTHLVCLCWKKDQSPSKR